MLSVESSIQDRKQHYFVLFSYFILEFLSHVCILEMNETELFSVGIKSSDSSDKECAKADV